MALEEIVFGEFEDDGEEDEELGDDGVVDVFSEGGDCVPVLVY